VKWPQPPGNEASNRASPHATVATDFDAMRINVPANPGLAAITSSTELLTGPRQSSQLK
jgi:hypothetical protein